LEIKSLEKNLFFFPNMKHPDFKNLSKKELKDYINANGFFCNAAIDKTETNAPAGLQEQIPEGAIYFKAIASNGDLNRNGYIIREKALKNAIKQYMENPVVLLQHDMNQPVGRVLRAQSGQDGITIEGYIFDEYTNGRFSRGLFNAVSTGHLTDALEFQNEATGEIITEEEFKALPWEEKENGNWVMAVTALDWLENSIVSIGANRKSLVKNKDLVKNYVEALKNEAKEEEEEENEDKKEEEQSQKTEPAEKPADEKEKVENPSAEDGKAENAVQSKESAVIEVSREEVKQVNEAILFLANKVKEQQGKISALESALDNIPIRKGLIVTAQNFKPKEEKPKSWLGSILEENGINLNS
jgi:hypothetical protein